MKDSVIRVILWLVLASVSDQLCWAAEGTSQKVYDEAYRPQFHFTYKVGWLSDICGPVYYDGEYHLFTQYCPGGPGLDYLRVHWGHAVSTDLVHWQELPPALAPDAMGPAFSGASSVVDCDNTSGFKSGEEKPIVAFYTAGTYMLDDNKDGLICLAYSNDRGRSWTKYADNPVMPPITHLNRDPKVFWHEPTKRWIMTMTLSCGGWLDGDYWFAIFSSPNLKRWKEESRFEMPKGIDCPDMFELAVDGDPQNTRWVYWAGDGTHAIGTFDGKTFTREGKINLPLLTWQENGANGYAAQTFSDMPASDGRRVQMSWLRQSHYPGMPFNQQATFPCALTLRKFSDGIKLCRQPIKEIEKLHAKKHAWANKVLEPGENLLAGASGDLFDIRAELAPGEAKEVGFVIRGIPVTYNVAAGKLTCMGKSGDLGVVAGKIKLQILVDRTTIEIFGNNGALSMTFSFTPDPAKSGIGVFAKGGRAKIASMNVYELCSIWEK